MLLKKGGIVLTAKVWIANSQYDAIILITRQNFPK